MPAGARPPEPLFSVLVGYETFAGRICELAGAGVIAPGSLVRWLDRAWVERVVFDGPSRVKDVGVRQRVFTGATRRAVEVRDRECFHLFCDLPAERCQIDHVQPWSEGGPTTGQRAAGVWLPGSPMGGRRGFALIGTGDEMILWGGIATTETGLLTSSGQGERLCLTERCRKR